MKKVFQFMAISLLLFALPACDGEKKEVIINKSFGEVKSFTSSDCKGFRSLRASERAEAITWEAVQGGQVKVIYHNMGHNCASSVKSFKIESLLKEERLYVSFSPLPPQEGEPVADCICLYDLFAVLGGFEVGKSYTLVLKKRDWLIGEINFTYSPDLKGELAVNKE